MYVELNNIYFHYEKDTKVLDNINLNMKHGEIVALLGNSGSGKSTLLRLISGLERPKEGTIVLNDKVLVSNNKFVGPEHRNIGMVFQDYALFPHMSVYKNIKFGLSGLPKEEKEQRIKEVLELVNLSHKIKDYPHQLSGGEQQRIALARSLATKPDILLLDEPFSNLDANLKKQIRRDLKNIIKQADITCLFVTHDEEDAFDIADTVIEIQNGVIKTTSK